MASKINTLIASLYLRKMMHFLKFFAPSLFVSIVLAAIPAVAQYTTASLAGTVVDPTGAVVPAAKVSIQNGDTGLTRATQTGSDGGFVFPSLPTGPYHLTVEKAGFQTYIQNGIVLTVNQAATVNVIMRLGQVATQVTVSANAQLVNTRSGTVRQLIGQRPILDLPLNGREVQQLVFLAPGAVDATNNYCLVNCQGGVYPGEQEAVVNGTGPGGVNYQLDGGDYNDTYMNTNLPFPNPDAVQEFSVQSSSMSAEYGHAAGGVVNIVTKSGTNQIHGDAFEFVRNGALNARNYFAPTTDTLKRNQFGATFGGPAVKNKLFYFGTFQYTPIRSTAQGEVAFVPTATERNGDFSAISKQLVNPVTGQAFPGNQIPVSQFSPASIFFLQHMPSPQGTGNEVTFAGPNTVTNDLQFMPKVDYITGKHHISARYFWTRFSELPDIGAARTNILAADGDGNQVTIQNIAVGDSYTMSPSLLFHTWFGYDRQTGGSLSGAPFGFPDAGIQVAAPTPPEINLSVGGFFNVATNHNGIFNRSDWAIREDVSKILGKHEIHFGGQYLQVKNHINNTYSMAGSFSFSNSLSGNDLVDFMLGDASSFSQGGGEFKDMTGNLYNLYLQDNYRATRRLTVQMGLRWDPYLPYQETDGRVVCFRPGYKSQRYPNAPVGMIFGGGGGASHDPGCPAAGAYSNLANLGPRLGFAYRLTQDGKTSLRGGAGIYYNPPMTTQYNAYADTAPFAPSFSLSGVVNFVNPYGSQGLANPFPAEYGPTIPGPDAKFSLPVSIRWYFPLNFHMSQMSTWNVGIERQLPDNWLLKLTYIGNKGTFLSSGSENDLETNPAIYIPGQSTEANTQSRRVYQNFSSIGLYSSDHNSNYNALQVTAQRSFSRGLQLLANYTWSKNLDDYGNSDPFDRDFDYGISSDNIPQLFYLSGTWQLPHLSTASGVARRVVNGWELTGIWTWRSGFPFSIGSGVDNSFSGVGSDRADFTGTSLSEAVLDPSRPHSELIQEYFNTSLFVPNAVGTFGNTAKNFLDGPGYFDVDLGLLKNIHITERVSAQFRAEFFNAFNSVNFGQPGSTLGSSSFGVISSASDPRILQFALKLSF